MENVEVRECYMCGNVLTPEEIETNNEVYTCNNEYETICTNCYENYTQSCNSCCRNFETERLTLACCTNSQEEYLCDDCLQSECEPCYHCDEYYTRENMYQPVDSDHYYCEECYTNELYYCNGCGNYFENELHYNEDEGVTYCDNCYEEHCNDLILSYTEEHQTEWKKHKLDSENENTTYYGIELEVESDNRDIITEEVYNKIISLYPCVLAKDGSLDYGFEIISQPLSFKYWKYKENDIKELLYYLKTNGYKSHDTNTCGLHIHVSRPSEEVINRILVVMETYKEELITFSRRSTDRLNQWSSFMRYNENDKKKVSSIKYINDLKDNSRYNALNLCNNNTIEFRLFRGTLNADTFLACLELVHNLVDACSNLKKPISQITWNYITRTEYVKNYVELKGIYTDKKPKDTTKEIEKEAKDITTFKNKICKVLLKDINAKIKKLKCNDININVGKSSVQEVLNVNSKIQYKINYVNAFYSKVNELINEISNSADYYTIKELLNKFHRDTYENYYSTLQLEDENFIIINNIIREVE